LAEGVTRRTWSRQRRITFRSSALLLYHDPDRTGPNAPVGIAKLVNVDVIQTYDFVVVPDQ
jgi:hypothetical protein